MFNTGDLMVYSAHGICQIDEICERTFLNDTKQYYVLHPVEQPKLSISIPVDNDKVNMLEIIHKDEAKEIIESFKEPGAKWIEKSNLRSQTYATIVNTGNRKNISKVINTLMRKKMETINNGKKFHEQDNRQLTFYQKVLFTELALSLNTTFDAIYNKVVRLIEKNVQTGNALASK